MQQLARESVIGSVVTFLKSSKHALSLNQLGDFRSICELEGSASDCRTVIASNSAEIITLDMLDDSDDSMPCHDKMAGNDDNAFQSSMFLFLLFHRREPGGCSRCAPFTRHTA